MMHNDDLLVFAEKMALELTELADCARECGSPLQSTEALLHEWESFYQNTLSVQAVLNSKPCSSTREEQLDLLNR